MNLQCQKFYFLSSYFRSASPPAQRLQNNNKSGRHFEEKKIVKSKKRQKTYLKHTIRAYKVNRKLLEEVIFR